MRRALAFVAAGALVLILQSMPVHADDDGWPAPPPSTEEIDEPLIVVDEPLIVDAEPLESAPREGLVSGAVTAATSLHVLAACKVIDVVTTLKIIAAGGQELNPVMAVLVQNPLAFVVVQVLFVASVYYLNKRGMLSPGSRVLLNGLACAPGFHNSLQLM